ncbi:MAG: hypothetical protein R2771_14055 [Saprospiraceae bacterium]
MIAGQKACVADNISIKNISSQEIANRADEDIVFENITLRDAIKVFNDKYEKEVIIVNNEDSEVLNNTLHITVKNGSVKEFIDIIKLLFQFDVLNSKGQFIITESNN